MLGWGGRRHAENHTPPYLRRTALGVRLSSVNWGDVPTWITAGAAVAATAFGAVTVRQIKSQTERERRLSLEGVAASWRAPGVPASPEADGTATWVYLFEVQNPGRLPITDLRVTVDFALDVQRVHYDGRVDAPTRVLRLDTPVLIGNGVRGWDRSLCMDYDLARTQLRNTKVTVAFLDANDNERVTVWPKRRAPLTG